MKKIMSMVLMGLLLVALAGCSADIGTKDVTIELGSEISDEVSEYLTSSKEDVLKDIELDVSGVDVMAVGEYTVTAMYKNNEYNITVNVVDTTAPTAELVSDEFEFEVGVPFSSDDIIGEVTEFSGEYTIEFAESGISVEELALLLKEDDETEEIPDPEEPETSDKEAEDAELDEKDPEEPEVSEEPVAETENILLDDSLVYAFYDSEGTYENAIILTDGSGNTEEIPFTVVIAVYEPAVIEGIKESITVVEGDTVTEEMILEGVSVTDAIDGDLTDAIEVDLSSVDTAKKGDYTITVKVVNSKGKETTQEITVIVKEKSTTTNASGSGSGTANNNSGSEASNGNAGGNNSGTGGGSSAGGSGGGNNSGGSSSSGGGSSSGGSGGANNTGGSSSSGGNSSSGGTTSDGGGSANNGASDGPNFDLADQGASNEETFQSLNPSED